MKCFFYTIAVPVSWHKFLTFNKVVPSALIPEHLAGEKCFLASRVLPMGVLNSVSLAQYVHRNLVLWNEADRGIDAVNVTCGELRQDRPLSERPACWHVYLDNYDLLERVRGTSMVVLKGSCSPGVLSLREQYEHWNIPRNVKKSVQRSTRCEVQGATVDGKAGLAYPKEDKLCKYFALALGLTEMERASQKQWQVVCGGLVYFCMFRRPLLGSLNRVWTHIESFNSATTGSVVSPLDCKVEVLRLLGLLLTPCTYGLPSGHAPCCKLQ